MSRTKQDRLNWHMWNGMRIEAQYGYLPLGIGMVSCRVVVGGC